MESLAAYFTDEELQAERAYRTAYDEEYLRVYQPSQAAEAGRLQYWSELAHRVARGAREKLLQEAEEREVEWEWQPRASIAQYYYPAGD